MCIRDRCYKGHGHSYESDEGHPLSYQGHNQDYAEYWKTNLGLTRKDYYGDELKKAGTISIIPGPTSCSTR
eukprot:7934173-Pyramimonas_sp.AAC.1